MMKRCTKCGAMKAPHAFGVCMTSPDGLAWHCRECASLAAMLRLKARGKALPCEHCGSTFLSIPRKGRAGERSRFCSPDCANKHRGDLAAWRRPMKACAKCLQEKNANDFRAKRLVCKKCQVVEQLERAYKSGETAACGNCGALFSAAKFSYGLAKYCSRTCADAGLVRKDEVPCENCGKVVLRAASGYSRVFCSIRCRDVCTVGAGNTKWKGGIRSNGHVIVHVGKRSGFVATNWAAHRVIASKVIGRQLTRSEHVIHIDNDLSNNHPRNLFVCESKSEWRRRFIGTSLPWPKHSNLEQLRLSEPNSKSLPQRQALIGEEWADS